MFGVKCTIIQANFIWQHGRAIFPKTILFPCFCYLYLSNHSNKGKHQEWLGKTATFAASPSWTRKK